MRWLPLYLVLLLVAGLSPGIPRCTPRAIWAGLDIADFVRNVLMFAPLGIALRSRSGWWSILSAALLSVGIEASQTALFRSANPLDVVANVVGSAAGWAATRRIPAIPTPSLTWRHGALLLAAATALVGISAAEEPPSNDFSNWESMPLSVGSEPDGSRAWTGELTSFAVYDDVERLGPPVMTAATGDVDHGRFQNTGEVAVTATFQLNAAPSGHGRIITCSRGPHVRCFTLGMRDRFLVWRVRTPSTGPNGMQPQIITREPLPLGEPVHVLATCDGTWSRVFVNGRCHDELLLPAFHAPPLSGNGVLLLIGVVTATAGLGLAAMVRRRRGVMLVIGAAMGVALLVMTGATSVLPIGTARTVVTPLLVVAAALPLLRRPALESEQGQSAGGAV